MRHTFNFPPHIRGKVRNYVNDKINQVDPKRYHQEETYVAALAKELEGVIYNQDDCYIEIIPTPVNSRGPKSAESIAGADLALTANIRHKDNRIEKAILVQAKLGDISTFKRSKIDSLKKDISEMKNYTRSPKVMDIPESNNKRHPRIISGNRILANESYSKMELGDYFVRRVLTTLDGDTRKDFVRNVQDSSLPIIHLIAKKYK